MRSSTCSLPQNTRLEAAGHSCNSYAASTVGTALAHLLALNVRLVAINPYAHGHAVVMRIDTLAPIDAPTPRAHWAHCIREMRLTRRQVRSRGGRVGLGFRACCPLLRPSCLMSLRCEPGLLTNSTRTRMQKLSMATLRPLPSHLAKP